MFLLVRVLGLDLAQPGDEGGAKLAIIQTIAQAGLFADCLELEREGIAEPAQAAGGDAKRLVRGRQAEVGYFRHDP